MHCGSHALEHAAPTYWAESSTHRECTLHQLSPYIGKLKSVIARDLVLTYSQPGDLVGDLFCGSGTVSLEAACLGRRVFACDTSTYAITLVKGKLTAPQSVAAALRETDQAVAEAARLPVPDLGKTPEWVRAFFHSQTLTECLQLVQILRERDNHFLLSALLGILHHQRPGFLSHPSSHLVPYLRTKRFPRDAFPELYQYRPILPRLRAKVERALSRRPNEPLAAQIVTIRQSSAESVCLPREMDCVITSPPYMNALDYCRDNRLRLWFLGESCNPKNDRTFGAVSGFSLLMRAVVEKLRNNIRPGGHCVFVVGDKTLRGPRAFPSQVLRDTFAAYGRDFSLQRVISDTIPDVRRSRRNTSGVTRESILVFRREYRAALSS